MRIIAILLILSCISGCATVGALNKLQELSSDRDGQQAYVKEGAVKFKQLVSDFSSGAIKAGISKDEIIEIYGEPISVKNIKTVSSFKEEFMYRHPAQFFGSERIFLYFDSGSKLIDAKYEN